MPKRSLEYWLRKLHDTKNRYISIEDNTWWNRDGQEEWEVCIGDADTHDYWVKQPYACGVAPVLSEAIEKALANYEIAQRQFLMNQLK